MSAVFLRLASYDGIVWCVGSINCSSHGKIRRRSSAMRNSPLEQGRTKVSCTSRIPANVSGTSRFQRKTQARELCVFTFSRLLLARHDLLRKVGLGFEPECAGTKLGHSGESGGRSTEDPHFVKREAELQRRMSPSSQHTAVTSRATDCLDNGID